MINLMSCDDYRNRACRWYIVLPNVERRGADTPPAGKN